MSKILVTGGAGFIGSHIVDAYLETGHDVVVVDNLSSGNRENLPSGVRLYEMNITSKEMEEVFASEKPEVVNHHAAQIDVRASVENPAFDAEVNVLGTINLLRLGVAHGAKRFLFASSGGAIYGEPAILPAPESSEIAPLAPYGASKAAGEVYINTFRRLHGLSCSILRYGNVYGPRQDPYGEAGVIAIFSSVMLAGGDISIFGTGEQLRDYVYVGDVAAANVAALNGGDAVTVNVGTARGTSVNELFNIMAQLADYQKKPIYQPKRPGELEKTYLDPGKAKELLGWASSYSLEEGLRETLSYFRSALAKR